MNQVSINTPIVVAQQQTYDFSSYRLVVEGEASKGQRSITVVIPILNEKGMRVSQFMVTKRGSEFNDLWAKFNSDKELFKAVMASAGVDTSTVDENMENVAVKP